ncbi:MAG: chemotaxis protein CheA [Deltaproteobacteria bacterium]|nr:MAG: chemotaxis protein CheA [Deltaproteobacteria bacterium]
MSEKKETADPRAQQEFLSEAQEIVESLNRDILQLDDMSKRGGHDPDLVNNIFRAAHSLKGLSGMFGAKKMSELAHTLENLLDSLRMGRITVTAEVIDVLFDSVEVFNRLIAEVAGAQKVPKRELNRLFKQLEAAGEAARAKHTDNPLEEIELDPSILSVLTEYEEYRLIDNIRRGSRLYKVKACFSLIDFDERLARLTERLKQLGEVITTLPSSEVSSDQEIKFVLVVGSAEGLEELQRSVSGDGVEVEKITRRVERKTVPENARDQKLRKEQQDISDPAEEEENRQEQDTDRRPASEKRKAAEIPSSLKSISQTVRVDIARLDYLMNIVGELVLVKMAVQSVSDQLKAERGFTGVAVDLYKQVRTFERKLDELQKGIMDVRMVQLQQLFDKQQRMVRKLSREFGKPVSMDISGADTELDKLIVEELADPLMHILRNCIDHGLEFPEERKTAGKPETGRIEMRAYQQGNHVVIEISDDGRGIDVGKVAEVAVKKGLADAETVAAMTSRDILNMIFLPGFSTSETVSEISGRGVGLDVVKSNIASLSGIIDVETERGKGTRFTITLPITLAIIRALIIEVGSQTYAVPLNSVMEILRVPLEQVRTMEGKEVMELRGATLPLLRLSEIFDLPDVIGTDEKIFVVVVGLAQNRLGIVVDGMVGQQDIVIKPLSRTLAKVAGIAGATNLANQQTVLVLDVAALVEEALLREQGLQQAAK